MKTVIVIFDVDASTATEAVEEACELMLDSPIEGEIHIMCETAFLTIGDEEPS